jgi:hypothetical protein
MHYFWINPLTAVTKSSVHGLCRYATKDIAKDDVIFVAGGIAKNTKESKWYKGLLIDQDIVLDLPDNSEYEAYINHSCDPNIYIDGQIVFRALRNISKDEYLCVDYGTFMITKSDPIPRCNCGSATCRGKVTGEDYKFLTLPLSWYAQKRKSNENNHNR